MPLVPHDVVSSFTGDLKYIGSEAVKLGDYRGVATVGRAVTWSGNAWVYETKLSDEP